MLLSFAGQVILILTILTLLCLTLNRVKHGFKEDARFTTSLAIIITIFLGLVISVEHFTIPEQEAADVHHRREDTGS